MDDADLKMFCIEHTPGDDENEDEEEEDEEGEKEDDQEVTVLPTKCSN